MARGDIDYEMLRSVMVDGIEFHASEGYGLAALIAHGMAAWIRLHQDSNAQKATSDMKTQPYNPRHTAEILNELIANLIEPKAAM